MPARRFEMAKQLGARPGRSLDEFIAGQETQDSEFAAARERIAPAIAVANAVASVRLARQMTQAELATLMGTTNTAISRLESGRQEPTIGTLQKLSDIFGLDFRVTSNAVEATLAFIDSPRRAAPIAGASRHVAIKGVMFEADAVRLVVAPDEDMPGAWRVLGDEGVLEREPTQDRAVKFARRLLSASGGVLEIQRPNGQTREIRDVTAAS
jgi:transcriptional regulator with XRE-family HTH domain